MITEIVQLIVKINKDAAANARILGETLKLNKTELDTLEKSAGGMARVGTRLGVAIKKTAGYFRTFRMELLSVMFFGMAVSGAMFGMLQPAFQVAGSFQIFGLILEQLFLPVALKLLPFFVELLKGVMALDPETKKIIGTLVILAGVLGTVLFFIGMMGLGISGIVNFFATVGPIISSVLNIGLLPLIGFFSVIIVLLAAFWAAWKENFGNIKGWVAVVWQGLKDMFEGIKEVISGIIDVVKGMFSGDTDLIAEGLKKMVVGALKVLKGLGDAILGIFVIGGLLAIKILRAALDLGIGIGKAIWRGIKSLGSMIWNFIKGLVPKKIRAFFGWDKEMEEAPATAFGGIVTRPQTRLVGEAGPEAIIPLDKMGMMGGVNISIVVNAAINSSVDLNNLARRIGAETASSLERNFRR